jgi:hypothetical protein
MNSKRVTVLILTAALILTAGIFVSFLTFSIFGRSGRQIVLPSSGMAASPASGEPYDFPTSSPAQVLPVSVSPETVQSVISTLVRPQSFYYRITAEETWEGGKDSFIRKVWARDGFIRVDYCNSGEEVEKSALMGNGKIFYWTPGSAQFWSGVPGDENPDDLQRIPTYEDVIELPTEDITAASYSDLNGESCICAEVADKDLSCTDKYWVSIGSGLLVLFERYEGETLVYKAAMDSFSAAVPGDERFTLPNHVLAWDMQ